MALLSRFLALRSQKKCCTKPLRGRELTALTVCNRKPSFTSRVASTFVSRL